MVCFHLTCEVWDVCDGREPPTLFPLQGPIMLACEGAAEEINTHQTAKINTFITPWYLLHRTTTACYVWLEAEMETTVQPLYRFWKKKEKGNRWIAIVSGVVQDDKRLEKRTGLFDCVRHLLLRLEQAIWVLISQLRKMFLLSSLCCR